LAFLSRDLDAVDAAVPRVQQVQIVGKAVGERDAVRRVWAGAVDEGGKKLLVLRQSRRRSEGEGDGNGRERQKSINHGCILPLTGDGTTINAGTATGEAFRGRSPRGAPARSARRSERTRSARRRSLIRGARSSRWTMESRAQWGP